MEVSPLCPACNQLLTKVGNFWICPEHGQVSTEPKLVAPLRIFLSYGHDHNEELVRMIKADLEKRGHDVWFDKNEIKFGDEWRRSITDGILGSNRVLSFLSKHSTRDPGVCRDEIAIAIGVKGGNIQTILVESEKEVQPPVNIGHIQWLDMHEWQEKKTANEAEWEQWYQAKLAEIVRVVESEETRRFAGEIDKLNEYLKPIKSDARISGLLSKGFYGREWLFDAVENWRSETPSPPRGEGRGVGLSRLFWIMGDPGVGKSAFAAQLTHTHGDTVIAAQFVEWDKPDHRDARRVVCSIAFQIATRLPDYRKLLLTLPEIKELDRKDASELFDYLLANPLKSVINGGREKLLIVIDALDEAGESGRNQLVEMLARNARHLPDWLGIVLTSRPEFDVKTPFQALNPLPIDTKSESNKSDIRNYLNNKLATQLKSQPNTEALVNQIHEKSEGVFLYAERFCVDVHQGHISLDQPDQFPQGLGGIFAQYFQRQFPDLEKFRKEIRPALRAILAAREPLPLEILQKLFNWEDEELRDFTYTLGSLFPVTKTPDSETIKPYHKSLADWMGDEAKSGVYFVSVMEGHKMLAELGWQELKETNKGMSKYSISCLPYHLIKNKEWNRLEEILCNILYIKEKCSNGMTFELISDYDFALKELPEALKESKNEEKSQKRVSRYIEEMINYSAAWNKARERVDNDLSFKGISKSEYIEAPEPILSLKPWTEKKINREIEIIKTNPSRLDKIKSFSQFVNAEANALIRYGNLNGFVVQHAYNYADAGIVVEEAKGIIGLDSDKVYLIKDIIRPPFNPFPALIKTFEGHTDIIWIVKLTANGKTAVSAGNDEEIRVWNIKTGECLKTIKGNKGITFSLSVGLDGITAITAGSDKKLRVWSLDSGDCMKILECHKATVLSIDRTPDSKLIVSTGWDRKICLCNYNDNKVKKVYKNSNYLTAICLTPDGKILVSVGPDKVLRVLDMSTGQVIEELKGHTGSIFSVSISADGLKAVTSSDDETVRIWDLKKGLCSRILTGHKLRIRSVSMTADGKIAVSCGNDRSIRIWDVETGECIKIFEGHNDIVSSVNISPDGKYAVSSSFDKTVRVWDIQKGIYKNTQVERNLINYFDLLKNEESDLNFTNEKKAGKLSEILKDYKSHYKVVKLAPSYKFILTAGYDKLLRIWEISSGKCTKVLYGHSEIINSISISHDGRTVATASDDKTIRIWDFESGELIAVYRDNSSVITLFYSKDDSRIIFKLRNGEVNSILMKNLTIKGPQILTIRKSQLLEKNLVKGSSKYLYTINCNSCGKCSIADKNIINLIFQINTSAYISEEMFPCIELPNHAWENPGLICKCIHCHVPIKINPFFIDHD